MSSGTNPVGAWALTASTGASVQDPTTYKGAIDANFAVAQRVADAFAPKPSSPAAMSVAIDPGFVVSIGPSGLQSVVEIGAQSVTIAAAPGAPNNRIDLIVLDEASGSASVIAGTPAGTPVPPGLTPGKKQLGLVSVPNGTTSIANTNITDLRAVWQTTVPGLRWTIAGGAADIITASYTPANATLADGLILGFRATAANATTAPSLNVDGLGAKTITKKGGQALLAGDIPGALGECLVRYNAANSRWELLNPAVALPTIANDHLLANISGATAAPVDTSLSALLDNAIGATPGSLIERGASSWGSTTLSALIDAVVGATRGAILERGPAGWTLIAPGASGSVLTANGPGADPSYQTALPPTAYGAVGTYTLAIVNSLPTNPWSPGGAYALSGLAGTWQCMGTSLPSNIGCCTASFTNLFVRIS